MADLKAFAEQLVNLTVKEVNELKAEQKLNLNKISPVYQAFGLDSLYKRESKPFLVYKIIEFTAPK